MRPFIKNSQGFTLIEILAVLVIMGVMASVAVTKINDITGTAELRALESGMTELNAREMLYWTNAKFASGGGWNGNGGDVGVWTEITPGGTIDLGSEYSWPAGPNRIGPSTLNFGSSSIVLNRIPSTDITSARWT